MQQVEQRCRGRCLLALQDGEHVFERVAQIDDRTQIHRPGGAFQGMDLAERRFDELLPPLGRRPLLERQQPGRDGAQMLLRLDLEHGEQFLQQLFVLPGHRPPLP